MNSSKRYMLITGAIILLVIAAFCIQTACNNAGPWTPFEPFEGQIVLMDRVYDKWFGEKMDIMADPAGQRIVCDWLMYKSYSAADNDKRDDALEQFNADSMEYVTSHTIRANYWSSVAAWEVFASANDHPEKVSEIINTCAPYAPELKDYFQNEIDAFRQIAKAEGIIDQNNVIIPQKYKWAFLLHRHVWVQASQLQFPQNAIQPPEEAMAMFKWQIEVASMPIETKLKKIQEMRNYIVGYDFDYAEAVLDIYSKNYSDACAILKENLSKFNENQKYNRQIYSRAIQEIKNNDSSACK